VGKPDLFAKRTLAAQAEPLTNGAASWKEAPDIGLEQVQSDGILVINDPIHLKNLEPPWNLTDDSDEILVEYKMLGDHLDRLTVARILLRRQAREVQRIEKGMIGRTPWLGRQTIWVVSAYVPKWAKEWYGPVELARGCHRFCSEHFMGLWVAANELPLRDELVPFLITRTGRPFLEFLTWVTERKAWPWVRDLLTSLSMLPQDARDYIKYGDPLEDQETRNNVMSWLFAMAMQEPKFKQELVDLTAEYATENEARDAVVRILQLRKLDVRPEQLARIKACRNVATLHQWRDQAVTAASADEALASD
jgi:hypothetical protein